MSPISQNILAHPRALIFDLDGTLSDPRQGIFNCFNQALTSLGQAAMTDQELTPFIGPPLEDCFRQLLGPEVPRQIHQAVRAFRDCYGRGGLYQNILYPEVTSLLQALTERGWQLFVATSKKEEFARRILHHFNIDIFFTDIMGVTAEQAGNKDALIADIIRRHQLSAAATIMIGDRSHDIIGARANGIESYGVLWGFGSQGELEEAGATKLFTTLADLQAFLLVHHGKE